MRIIRQGIGILALAAAIGTVGACSSSRNSPDHYPRATRGTVYYPGSSRATARAGTRSTARAKTKTKVKQDNRGGRRGDNGLHRGQNKNGGNSGKAKKNRGRGND